MDFSLLIPPFLAGLIVLATHVPLGMQVLNRGIIFIDLAVAQLAGLGVIVIHVAYDTPSIFSIQFAALFMALMGGLLFRWLEKRWASRLEAMIGATFVLSTTAALLLLSNDPHGGEKLKDLLAGQLLWVTHYDLLVSAFVSSVVLLAWWTLNPARNSLLFYMLFAVAVTMSVQLVGVYLVFSSLIFPALGIYLYNCLSAGYIMGGLGYLIGLILSLLTDLPTGPTIVWSLAFTAALGSLVLHFVRKNSTAKVE